MRRLPDPTRWVSCVLVVVALTANEILPSSGFAFATNTSPDGRTIDGNGLSQSQGASLLILYYEAFLRDQNIESFRRNVSARYKEGSLVKLIRSVDPRARQSSILALGLTGSYSSNAAVARGLRDPDPIVRDLASTSLWLIWFRADSVENNKALEQVRAMIGRGMFDEAIAQATLLIARSPNFAEAYNQRAIAYYASGQLAESIDDCRKALDHNPYHFGALGGMGQCQLRLGLQKDALETFRRALKLQPHSEGLKDVVSQLEDANP